MGSEEEEELDFLTYCSNVEDQDHVYRTFIKLSQFSSPPATRSELILPLSREEDLITIPDESADQTIPGEDISECPLREYDNTDKTPDVLISPNPPDSSGTIDHTQNGQSSLAPIPAPSVLELTVPTSTPPAPPLSPKPDISLLPPPLPERISPPLHPTPCKDLPPPPPPPPTSPAATPPKPDRTFLTSPSQVLRKTLEIETVPPTSAAAGEDTIPPATPAADTEQQSSDTSALPQSADMNLNTSGTLSRNLSKNMPEKPLLLKDKSLVKSVPMSPEPLFLPRSALLRKASCQDNAHSPVPHMRAIRSGSCPSHSTINLTDLSRFHNSKVTC